MKTVVLIKVVDGEINPFDQSALETALSKENNEVTVLSMGPRSWAEILRPLTRLGVKRVVLLSDPVYAGSDTLATSYILSRALARIEYDLILCGRKTLDGETAQVGPCLATMLGLPVVTNVFSFDTDGREVVCRTPLGVERAALPVCLSMERTKQLRFPSLFSRPGEVEILTNDAIGADPARCGLAGSPTKVIATYESAKGERNCRLIQPSELLPLIRDLLRQKKRVVPITPSEKKLPSVFAVGEEVLERAQAISDKVTLIEKDAPETIAKWATAERPDAILWNADVWGRRNAPVVQAILGTGLCADCTDLETDGKRLYMIRPARAGNITAKIRCDTFPQMATVRTADLKTDEIIVAAGRGVGDSVGLVRAFARMIGAGFAASRALVDLGGADYPEQVGLTGRIVRPKVYIAIGISGAVQHVAGISDSDVIIAVNSDREARIFGFADYGIVCDFEQFYREIGNRIPKGEGNYVGL